MDKTPTLNGVNFMTLRDLVIVPREFYPNETHFFSLLLKMLPHHQNRLRGSLLNANKTLMKLPLRLV
jgi:hypothetical protein